MMKQTSILLGLAGSSIWAPSVAQAKAVFAHYMVQGLDESTNHAETDIQQAIDTGFDAFALNVGAPGEDWVTSPIQQLFDAAAGKDFGLFFSFDFYGDDDLGAHKALYDNFKNHEAYYRYGADDLNVVSTFSGGSLGADTWAEFKQKNNVFLIPNAEADGDYYDDPDAFFENWNDALDGVFTWETAWPGQSDKASNVTSDDDEKIKKAADNNQKAYMIGLSPLQFKYCCGNSYYRAGESTLPERMEQILSLEPELTEVMTWNDAGESHYIGNAWEEGLTDDVLAYANPETYAHDGWQPLISSFIDAFRDGKKASDMAPRSGDYAGAMWYRGQMTSTAGSDLPGSGAAEDAVNYAIVLPGGSEGFSVRVRSGGEVLRTDGLKAGLNYNSIGGMTTGAQEIELLDGEGSVVANASSKWDVIDYRSDDFPNFNYYVVSLA